MMPIIRRTRSTSHPISPKEPKKSDTGSPMAWVKGSTGRIALPTPTSILERNISEKEQHKMKSAMTMAMGSQGTFLVGLSLSDMSSHL